MREGEKGEKGKGSEGEGRERERIRGKIWHGERKGRDNFCLFMAYCSDVLHLCSHTLNHWDLNSIPQGIFTGTEPFC